jgi:acyl-CoA thioesterase-1
VSFPRARSPRTSRTAALLLAVCAAVCAGPDDAASSSAPLRLLSLGDSVPAGDVCGCTAFPDLVADGLAPAGGADVVQRASGGATSTDVDPVLRRLAADEGPRLGAPDVVLLQAGANDLVQQVDLATSTAGAADTDATIGRVVATLAGTVDELTATGARVVVLDYWAVGLDGAVARQEYTPAELHDQVALTDAFDDRLAAAVGNRALFVDLRPVFHGPDGTGDPTTLLAADGDHPDAAGHRAIADAVLDVLAGSEGAAGSPGDR